MKRGREIRNLPIIEVASGKVLGSVSDLLITADQKLAGLYILTEAKDLRFLPLERIVNLGRDAILVAGREDDFRLITEPYTQPPSAGAWVMTAEGKSLGTIDDIVVEENEGSIVGYEVSDGYLLDLLQGKRIVEAADIVTYGTDAVIIAEDS